MQTAPVISSIISPQYLASYVQELYNLKGSVSCKILKTGINDTYLISTINNKFVLRVYHYQWRTKTEIQEELRLLHHLHTNGISVSFPVADRTGQEIKELQASEGMRYMVLFSYALGEKIRNLDEQHCTTIGETMAKMHQLSLNFPLNRTQYNTHSLLEKPYQYATTYLSENCEGMLFAKQASHYAQKQFANANEQNIRKGVVHLDIWYDNMSISTDGTVTLFDFDFCGNGWLVFDIAYTVIQLFQTEPDKDRFQQKLQAYYQGYEAITSIPKVEKELIVTAGIAVWVFYAGVQAQRFQDWSNLFYSDNYMDRFMGMLKNWIDYHQLAL